MHVLSELAVMISILDQCRQLFTELRKNANEEKLHQNTSAMRVIIYYLHSFLLGIRPPTG